MKASPGKLSVGFLFDDTLDSDDGVAQYVKRLGAWLSSRGHKVVYLVGQSQLQSWQDSQVIPLSKNLKVTWNGNKLSISLLPKIRLIKRVLADNRFDVIHVQAPYSPFMSKLVISRARPQTAVVGTFHVFPAGWATVAGSKLLKLFYGRSLRRFDAMTSVSSAAQSYAKSSFGLSSIVIPNPVDSRILGRRPSTAPSPGKRIIFLGRLVKRKGCEQLIEAFAAMSNRQGAHLIIAGDGPERDRLKALVNRLGLSGAVEFKGYITEADKPGLLASADIACFPSLYGESFGIVLIEAMTAGSPIVIAGDNPGYRSVLADRPELLVDANDTASFARKLEHYLTRSPETQRIGQWLASEAKRYDVAVVGSRIENLYRQAIAKRLAKQ